METAPRDARKRGRNALICQARVKLCVGPCRRQGGRREKSSAPPVAGLTAPGPISRSRPREAKTGLERSNTGRRTILTKK